MVFWAKCKDGFRRTVEEHLKDSAHVAKELYGDFLSDGLRKQLPLAICVFAAAAHDIGKASPAFQNYIQKVNKDNQPRHWLISYRFLIRKEFDKSLALVLASHHGTPPDIETLKALDTGGKDRPCGFKDHVYIAEQERLLALALDEAGIGLDEAKAIKLDKPRQVLLSGFLVLCDWIASGRAEGGEDHGLTEPWKSAGFRADETYGRLLGGNAPRPVQAAVADIFARANKPGLIIIEAPMGEGKTEAALAAAEAMAERSNRGGLFFALPTQATSNAMFSRVRDWLEKLKLQEPHTIDLVHGRKLANSEFKKMYGRGFATDGEPEDMLSVNSWTQNRKKALFSNFVVGTVDHLLMAALKQKHFML
ncbi:MAG: CRISPR-associated endonuclease Cas3'', partial [Clostridiales Family XIII bacterium]|nr:CRISPR-associated endonuclease Cas3'' [Clostridiales Family XIII bacterium]